MPLVPGDTIGIVFPSSFIQKEDRYKQGISFLRARGFKLKFGPLQQRRYYDTTGTPAERAEEINRMFADPEVKAIIASDGGFRAIEVLDLLDYDLIRRNPKILSGLGDITHLLLAVYSKTGLKTIYGQDVINGFGDADSVFFDQSTAFFFDLVNSDSHHITAPRLTSWKPLKQGRGEGILVGGLLQSVCDLTGSPYFPDNRKQILFWEASGLDPRQVNILLRSLRLSGLFDRLSGMAVGKFEEENQDYPFEKIISEACADYSFPILSDIDFGCGAGKLSFPIGANALLDVHTQTFILNR